MSDSQILALTSDIVSSHISNNTVAISDLTQLIQSVHSTLAGLREPDPEPQQKIQPAVSIRASVRPDYIVCLEDGLKMRSMKRHLRSAHGLTPEAYREKWGLASDYPMVAPSYAEARRALAKSIGLGKRGRKPAKRKSSKRQ